MTRRAMPKGLHLKKTLAEEAENDMRRARRAAKKSAAKKAANRQYRAHDADFDSDGRSSKRSRTMRDEGVDLDPPFSGPGPSTLHYGARTAPVEESFQEKLWDALGDDERLDGIEARLNDYAHVPRRWRGDSSHADSPDAMGGSGHDPNFMNDDEYAEWVRVGIWRYVLPAVRAQLRNNTLTESAMPRHFVSRSGKGRLTLRRRPKRRESSGRRKMPVGAHDMCGNTGGVQMPEVLTTSAGLGCSNQN